MQKYLITAPRQRVWNTSKLYEREMIVYIHIYINMLYCFYCIWPLWSKVCGRVQRSTFIRFIFTVGPRVPQSQEATNGTEWSPNVSSLHPKAERQSCRRHWSIILLFKAFRVEKDRKKNKQKNARPTELRFRRNPTFEKAWVRFWFSGKKQLRLCTTLSCISCSSILFWGGGKSGFVLVTVVWATVNFFPFFSLNPSFLCVWDNFF